MELTLWVDQIFLYFLSCVQGGVSGVVAFKANGSFIFVTINRNVENK